MEAPVEQVGQQAIGLQAVAVVERAVQVVVALFNA